VNVLPPGVELQDDVSPAEWVAAGLRKSGPAAWPVASVVPEGFDSYARIQHEHDGDPTQVEGTIPATQMASLMPVLADFTTTPETTWFAMWEGKGSWYYGSHSYTVFDGPEREETLARLDAISLERDRIMRAAAKFEASGENYFLFRGPLSAAASLGFDDWLHDTANFWWPEDRAWCVGTNIDVPESYVGGTEPLTERLMDVPGLNASQVSPDQDLRKLIPKH
jgi:hypothetical protein